MPTTLGASGNGRNAPVFTARKKPRSRRGRLASDPSSCLLAHSGMGCAPMSKSPEEQNPEAHPKAFISYSHDSVEHKAWVYALATRLREKGVDVNMDEFGVEPGDDLPKYMERSIQEADRVLMICTPAYVQKVDDGVGGAGYEGMLVTSELVVSVGQAKFIPIVRQGDQAKRVPRCVSTRLRADLSGNPYNEAEFNKLLAAIHRHPPPTKPPLGPIPKLMSSLPVLGEPAADGFSDDPAVAYVEALALAQSGDAVVPALLEHCKPIDRTGVGMEAGGAARPERIRPNSSR